MEQYDDMQNEASGMVYDEIGEFADGMMAEQMGKDLFENRANPKNIPGADPAEPGITIESEIGGEDMDILEGAYGMEMESAGMEEPGLEVPGVV